MTRQHWRDVPRNQDKKMGDRTGWPIQQSKPHLTVLHEQGAAA